MSDEIQSLLTARGDFSPRAPFLSLEDAQALINVLREPGSAAASGGSYQEKKKKNPRCQDRPRSFGSGSEPAAWLPVGPVWVCCQQAIWIRSVPGLFLGQLN